MKMTTSNLLAATLFAVALFYAPSAMAQGGQSPAVVNNSMTQMNANQAVASLNEKYLSQQNGDPREDAAYQAFHKLSEKDAEKKIKLGSSFLTKYPKDHYTQAVYEELSQTYYDNKDLTSFYSYSEKGLAQFPDDVHLLALTGWAIPRAFDAKDPNADKRLGEAETFEKHALDLLPTLPKPAGVSDEQWTSYKSGEAMVAHSGLGLIYFRREDYDNSTKELEASISGIANPDPTDLFVLGADLENTGKWKDAADAFNRCAQVANPMQDNCKKQAANAAQHSQ
jgi:tetratricopeptide (TPR) repeat protein